ncbi:histidine kinase [Mycolicibacterium sp. XJ1819]
MDLQRYVDAVRHDLTVAAAAAGQEARALAERLTAALDPSVRLALLEALSEAAEQITRELAPGSVQVRLRGREPQFVVDSEAQPVPEPPVPAPGEDDGRTWRVTLRLPEQLRPRVEAAARAEGLSVNTWLVRATTAALGGSTRRHRGDSDKHFSGWVR